MSGLHTFRSSKVQLSKKRPPGVDALKFGTLAQLESFNNLIKISSNNNESDTSPRHALTKTSQFMTSR